MPDNVQNQGTLLYTAAAAAFVLQGLLVTGAAIATPALLLPNTAATGPGALGQLLLGLTGVAALQCGALLLHLRVSRTHFPLSLSVFQRQLPVIHHPINLCVSIVPAIVAAILPVDQSSQGAKPELYNLRNSTGQPNELLPASC